MHRCKARNIMRNEAYFSYAGVAHRSRCAFFNSLLDAPAAERYGPEFVRNNSVLLNAQFIAQNGNHAIDKPAGTGNNKYW